MSREEAAVCLLAVERRGIHLEHECSSASQYAERFLGIEAYIAVEMLRVAKALEHLHELSEAFRTGEISWTSIREITRRAEAATDAEWAGIGRRLSTAEIQRLCVRSPRAWEREQKLERQAQADEQPVLFAAACPGGSSPGGSGAQADDPPVLLAAVGDAADESVPLTVSAAAVAPTLSVSPAAQRSTALTAPQPVAAPPAKPILPGGEAPRIGLEFRLTPELYELYKQLQSQIRASHRGPLSREQVFEEVCRRALSGDGKKSRTRTILVLHYDPQTAAAWTETDRGVVPVPGDVAEAAMETGTVIVAPAASARTAESSGAEAPPVAQPASEISTPKSATPDPQSCRETPSLPDARPHPETPDLPDARPHLEAPPVAEQPRGHAYPPVMMPPWPPDSWSRWRRTCDGFARERWAEESGYRLTEGTDFE